MRSRLLPLLILAMFAVAACSAEEAPAEPKPREQGGRETAEAVLERHKTFMGRAHWALHRNAFGIWQQGDDGGALSLLQRGEPFALRLEWHRTARDSNSVMTVTDGRVVRTPLSLMAVSGVPLPPPPDPDVATIRASLEQAFFLAALFHDPTHTRGHVGYLGRGTLKERAGAGDDPKPGTAVETLRFDTPAGTVWLAHFDAVSGALVETEEVWTTRSRWMRFTDHREVDGVRFPYRWTLFTEGDRAPLVVAFSVWGHGKPTGDGMFAVAPQPDMTRPHDGGVIEFAPMTVPGSAQVIARDLRINDGPLIAAVVDTGADSLSIHPELAAGLRLPPCTPWAIGTIGGSTQVGRAFVLALAHGAHVERQFVASVLQPPSISQLPMDRQPGCVWGGAELNEFSPVFDFAKGRLQFRGAKPAPLDGKSVVHVPLLVRRPGRPLRDVEITVGGRALRVLLDTGSSPTLRLTTGGLRALGLPDTRDAWRARGEAFATSLVGASGELIEEFVVRFQDVAVGPVLYEAPLVHLIFDDRAGAGGSTFLGLLGGGAFLPFDRAGIDASRERLELQAGSKVIAGENGAVRVLAPAAWLGLMVVSALATAPDAGLRVPRIADVADGSPAALRGLRPGSALLAIDGVSCADRSAADINRSLWLPPGASVELRVREENGDELRVRLP
ncbi:MAG: aspartyl protease family protein [Planctomycetes bacterium]|nr:aspartyl protease family protein [Planctomycetota bacterium]